MNWMYRWVRGTRRLTMRLYEISVFTLLVGVAWTAGASPSSAADDDEAAALLRPAPAAQCGNIQSSTVVMHR